MYVDHNFRGGSFHYKLGLRVPYPKGQTHLTGLAWTVVRSTVCMYGQWQCMYVIYLFASTAE